MRLDAGDIEAIAHRVAELLGDPANTCAVRYVDAAHVADALGVDREWVYAHAHQLGAIRLGGPHGRLRFDLQHLIRTLAGTAPEAAGRPASRPRRRARHASAGGVELLPYES